MAEPLLLQKEDKLFLLLRGGQAFHLISVDERLTAEREEKLLAIYPCSDASLRELELNFQKLSIRGVAIGGCEAGDTVILYIDKQKRKYVLSDDYAPEMVDAFFSGIERFQMPKQKKQKDPDSWRKAEQDPAMLPKLRILRIVLTAISLVSSGLAWVDILWGLPGILVSILCLLLDIYYPAYFTLLDWRKGKTPKHALGLGLAASLPVMVSALVIMNTVNYLVWWQIWLWSALVGAVLSCVIGRFAREFQYYKEDMLAVVILLVMFSQGPIGVMNSALDFSLPETQTVPIIDMYISDGGRSSDRHYCTILLEDGTEFDLHVTRLEYEALSVGERITVSTRTGGLGIGYIALVEK